MGWWHSGGAAGFGPGFHGGMGWGGGFFGGLMMLLVLGLLILLAVWAVHSLRRDQPGGPGGFLRPVAPATVAPAGASPAAGDQALEIVKERYARGEIDRDTYEQMRQTLSV